MRILTILRRLLPIFAIVGLVTAPLAVPAVADTMAAGAMSEMTGDVPCCLPEKPMMPDCQKSCPLLNICLAKVFHGVPAIATTISLRQTHIDVVVPDNDAARIEWASVPPPRPPRA